MHRFLIVFLFLFASSTHAANHFGLDLSSEYGDAPKMRIGDKLRLLIKMDKPGYINLFHQDALAQLTLIIPSKQFPNQFYQKQFWAFFPAAATPFEFQIYPPKGTEKFLIIASNQKLDLGNLSSIASILKRLEKIKQNSELRVEHKIFEYEIQ